MSVLTVAFCTRHSPLTARPSPCYLQRRNSFKYPCAEKSSFNVLRKKKVFWFCALNEHVGSIRKYVNGAFEERFLGDNARIFVMFVNFCCINFSNMNNFNLLSWLHCIQSWEKTWRIDFYVLVKGSISPREVPALLWLLVDDVMETCSCRYL